MKDLAETLYLQKRNDVWYYVRRVPNHLVSTLGKRFIKQSLNVTDRKEAKQHRSIVDAQTNALFAATEMSLSPGCDQGSSADKGNKNESFLALISSALSKIDQENANSQLRDPPANKDELDQLIIDAVTELQIMENPVDDRKQPWILSFIRSVTENSSTQFDIKQISSEQREISRRALVELAQRRVARLTNNYAQFSPNPMFAHQPGDQTTVGDLAQMYLEEIRESHTLNRVSAKRTDKVAAHVNYFMEVLGADTLASEIDDKSVQNVKSSLARTPANRGKYYPKLSLEVAIKRAEKDQCHLLSPTTQKIYLSDFKNMMKLAVRKRLISFNPAEDAKPIMKETVSSNQRRLPFSNAQIVGFFTGKFYQSCARDAVIPYAKPDRDWRFWIPLLMLFTGARLNEIAQLHIEDIVRHDQFLTYIDISENAEEENSKSIKTTSSKRKIPIHGELIRLGFLNFVEIRRKAMEATGPRLFPELHSDRYGNYGRKPSRSFNSRFLREEIELVERQSLYSFRHNFRDALRRIEAPPDVLLALGGWVTGPKSASDNYGEPSNPSLYLKWIKQISYEGLGLTFLYDAY